MYMTLSQTILDRLIFRGNCMKKLFWLLMCLFMFSGCASLSSFADTLNERKVQSCIYWSGFVGGALNGVQAQVKGVTSTGGVPFNTCLKGTNAN